VAFSCKRRGFCLGCVARRMAETAAHLVDHVIPRVPVRQWVLSFPIPLRLLFATHPQLLAPLLRIVHRVIATFLIQQAGLKRTEAHTGYLRSRSGQMAHLTHAVAADKEDADRLTQFLRALVFERQQQLPPGSADDD
jgi:hypothetical protein